MHLSFVNGRPLFVPGTKDRRPVGMCQVIVTGEGELCLTPFYSERERRDHVAACAQKHTSAIHAYRKRTHPDIMRPWDPEMESWMSKHADGLLAGRLKV